MNHPMIITAVAILALTPFSATAQQVERTTETTTTAPVEHHDFPWGLLGLIGLAGLIPRKQNVVNGGRTNTTRQ